MITPAQLWRRLKERKGFTLAEVIIASSIFTVVSIIGVTVFVDVMRIQRRITLENAIYEDARFMMERIAREIRYNTIDYEEYYRANHHEYGLDGPRYHGEDFGCYAQAFYNPGPDGIGALCSFDPVGGQVADNPGCVVDKNTLDVNTGQNPYIQAGFTAVDANALCDTINHGDSDCNLPILITTDVDFEQEQLFLINPEGTRKTFLGSKDTGAGEHAVAMLRVSGEDTDSDGIVDKWFDATNKWQDYCEPGYNCPAGDVTDLDANLAGADDLYDGFVPLTPLRTDVLRLSFLISPVEDPRKAFAETITGQRIQQQPHVIVVMTVTPAQSELEGFAGDPPEVTLQTTVTSRVYNEVESYIGRSLGTCT